MLGPVAVGDRSYIANTHTYSTLLPSEDFTATLTVGADSAQVTVRVLNPAGLSAEDLLSHEFNRAIEDGLRSQYFRQTNRAANFGGSFASWSGSSGSSATMSYTSLAVLAFENHGHNPATGSIYSEVVQRGLNFIFDNLRLITLSNDGPGGPCAEIYAGATYGDPLAPGPNCTGLSDLGGIHGYSTSVELLAIAGSGAPAATAAHGTDSAGFTVGKTYLEIVQRLINTMAFSQLDGGWVYTPNSDNDGSANGWNALGLIDGQAFGATIPGFVLPQFEIGTAALSRADGGMGYRNAFNQNTAKTGIRLQALHLIGVALGDLPPSGGPTPQTSVDYINGGWKGRSEPFQCGNISPIPVAPFQTIAYRNNFGCMYAMFNVFKGLKLYGVATLPNSSRADLDWHREYQDYLAQVQSLPTTVGGGGWGNLAFSCCSGDTNGETALALLVLAASATILPDPVRFAELGLQHGDWNDPPLAGAFEAVNDINVEHLMTARALSVAGTPVPGASVDFEVLAGPNPGVICTGVVTDANGEAVCKYTSSLGGTDTIEASMSYARKLVTVISGGVFG